MIVDSPNEALPLCSSTAPRFKIITTARLSLHVFGQNDAFSNKTRQSYRVLLRERSEVSELKLQPVRPGIKGAGGGGGETLVGMRANQRLKAV